MVTLRMVWLAVALLIALPVGWALADHALGHFEVPGGEIVRGGAEEAATVTDIVLADMPQKLDRDFHFGAPEQLVEGHTVFLTIDLVARVNESNFTVDIKGDVECHLHSNVSGPEFMGIPIPNRVHEFHEECSAGGVVFVTPDPFVNSSDTTGSTQSAFSPTGRFISFTAPDGQQGEAQEWTYDIITTDWLGQELRTTLFAWSVPVLEPWTDSDGAQRSWYCPIPEDRLLEMGITHFTARHEDEMPELLFAQ